MTHGRSVRGVLPKASRWRKAFVCGCGVDPRIRTSYLRCSWRGARMPLDLVVIQVPRGGAHVQKDRVALLAVCTACHRVSGSCRRS